MKVILRDDVKGKGNAGDIIEVKPGFARNYLIPQGFAYNATDKNIVVYEQEKRRRAKLDAESRREAENLKVELEKISLTAAVKVGEEDRLFGSVTSNTIAELLMEKGYEFNHRKINIAENIKDSAFMRSVSISDMASRPISRFGWSRNSSFFREL